MALEAIIIGGAVAVAGMVLARHVRRETAGGKGSCSDCCSTCVRRTQCSLLPLTEIKRDQASANDPERRHT